MYEKCVKAENVKDKKGIKERCAFHILSNFHVFDNLSVDSMHDVLEGICRYDVGKILEYFMYQKKFLTLKFLNDKIISHDFGSNNLSCLVESQIKEKKL